MTLEDFQEKAGSTSPTGRLFIVYDYFTHGAGDYFSVDSYPVGTSTIVFLMKKYHYTQHKELIQIQFLQLVNMNLEIQ